MGKVSIIIPAYNCEKTIALTIDSVLNQSFQDYELIIINDGSTDNSDIVIKKYLPNNKIKYICQENGGVSKARNTGLEQATGNYICFLDSDDYYKPTFLEKMIQKIQDNDVCYCGYVEFDNIKNIRRKKKMTFSKTNVLRQYYLNRLKIQTGCFMIKKELIDRLGITFTVGISWAEDVEFFTKILNSTNMINFVDEYLLFYNITNNGLRLSSFSANKIDKDYYMIKKIIKENQLDKDDYNALVNYRLPALLVYNLLLINDRKIKQDYYKKYYDELKKFKFNNGLRSIKVFLALRKVKSEI